MQHAEPRILSGGHHGDPARPLVTIDLDGVLCEPLFGLNLTSRGAVLSSDAVASPGRFKRLAWRTEPVRYYGRRRISSAAGFLRQLAPHFRLYLVTARGLPAARHTRGWLKRNGLWRYLDGLVFRAGPEMRPYQFKAATVAALQPFWHVDDDGRTAMHVAGRSGRPVLLIAWPGNAGTYPKQIVRVPSLATGAAYLLHQREDSPSSSSSMSISPAIDAVRTS